MGADMTDEVEKEIKMAAMQVMGVLEGDKRLHVRVCSLDIKPIPPSRSTAELRDRFFLGPIKCLPFLPV
jgi:hypothetical protein